MARIKDFFSGKRLDENSPPPYFLKLRSSKAFIISTICIAVFTDIFLYGLIVPVSKSLTQIMRTPLFNVPLLLGLSSHSSLFFDCTKPVENTLML